MSEAKAGGTVRESGIELLRILAAAAVIVLHFNYLPGGGGALERAEGFNAVFLTLLETVCICAVNIFILISGYFASRADRVKTGKLAGLLLQTMAFGGLLYTVTALWDGNLQIRALAGAVLPVNYFVILYIVLMLLSPYLNALANGLQEETLRRMTVLLLLVFSVFATGVDVLKEITGDPLAGLSPVGVDGSMNGYSIVHFAVMYLLGACLRRIPSRREPSPVRTIAAAAAVMGALYAWSRFLPGTAWMYCHPLVIAESVLIFRAFAAIRWRSRIINALAPASFSCYLIHETVLVRLDPAAAGRGPFPALAGTLAAAAAGIYALAFLLETAWRFLQRKALRRALDRMPVIACERTGKA